ncbi:signal peptidase I [Corynebacterium sp.]|uniref:signal peptidase I n=1 Tax=Corynebacterium sp. TaxID=1720 RepID=UPI0026DFC3C2|nr:signal peptidase I [Corynebacterium sp.]MDO5511465.1 signal peptidase I [Corynebacterium sp.]
MSDAEKNHEERTGSTAASASGADQAEKKPTPWYIEIPVVIAVTLLAIFLIQTFVGRVYMIPSQSMEPTLHGCAGCTGDRIFVDKISYRFGDPQAGDVVVYKGTDSWNQGFVSQRSQNDVVRALQNAGSYVGLVAPDENDLVKRIVATGGQTVSCQEGDPAVMVDGQPIDQSYILEPPAYPVDPTTGSEACGGSYFGPLTVPENNYFMMGDNRTNSADSRAHIGDEFQGTIPDENIRGKVQAIIFPFNRIGGVADPAIQE